MMKLIWLLSLLLLCAPAVDSHASEAGGYWKLTGSPVVRNPYPSNWPDQNGWEGRIDDASAFHVTTGFRHPSVQKEWNKGRSSWIMAPSILPPDAPIRVGVKHEDLSGPSFASFVWAKWGHRMIKSYRIPTRKYHDDNEVIPGKGQKGQRITLIYGALFSSRKGAYEVHTVYEWVNRQGPKGSTPTDPTSPVSPPSGKPGTTPPQGEKPSIPYVSRNLASGKRATQSSVYVGTGVNQGAHRGIDGKRQKDPDDMFHTNADKTPWWMVDLGAVHELEKVRLYNRPHQTATKANTVEVLYSIDGSAWTTVYSHPGTNWEKLTLPLPGRARFVRLQLRERTYFHLMEVEVWGDPVPVKK